jgi:hypothetical protein
MVYVLPIQSPSLYHGCNITRVVQKVKTASTHVIIGDFAWGVSLHPRYSPDLAPSDFHLFTHLKQFLGSTHMCNDEEVKKTVKDWQHISTMQAYRNSSYDMINARIFMGIMQKNDLRSVIMM